MKHCCKEMQREANRTCEQHPNRFDCPDCLIVFQEKANTFGLMIHDGGSSSITIRYCPWCGTKLQSK